MTDQKRIMAFLSHNLILCVYRVYSVSKFDLLSSSGLSWDEAVQGDLFLVISSKPVALGGHVIFSLEEEL